MAENGTNVWPQRATSTGTLKIFNAEQAGTLPRPATGALRYDDTVDVTLCGNSTWQPELPVGGNSPPAVRGLPLPDRGRRLVNHLAIATHSGLKRTKSDPTGVEPRPWCAPLLVVIPACDSSMPGEVRGIESATLKLHVVCLTRCVSLIAQLPMETLCRR